MFILFSDSSDKESRLRFGPRNALLPLISAMDDLTVADANLSERFFWKKENY